MSFQKASSNEGCIQAVPVETSLPLPTRIAFIGNYLPRQCGIATFTTDLCAAMAAEFGAMASLQFR